MSYLNFKSQYDRFPVISINDSKKDIYLGKKQIISELKKIKKGIICFETYPGIDLEILRKDIIEGLKPNQIIFIENYSKSESEYDEIIKDNLF